MKLAETLKKVSALDRAWNERRWDDYSSFYSDEVVVFINGMTNPQNKKDFLIESRFVCELFPDSQVLIDPYINLFASSNECLTCSVAWVIGSKTDAFVLEVTGSSHNTATMQLRLRLSGAGAMER
jgi:hypothetical protein